MIQPRLCMRSVALSLMLAHCVAAQTAQPIPTQPKDSRTQTAAPSTAVDPYPPTLLPDRIVLTWADDPRTSQAVTWRTSTEVKTSLAEIVVADAGPYFAERAKQVKSTIQPLKTNNNEAHFHSVQFTGLEPGTKYAYRVGDGSHWSEWFHFSTAKVQEEPFTFIYFGDAQNNIRSQWSRVVREAYSDAPKASFIIHAGDLINNAENDAEWGEWFSAGGWVNAMIPNVPIPGNHEQAKDDSGSRRLSHHWRPSFSLPENGPPGLEESCYTFVYQNLRVIGLNSNEQIETQAKWLESVLARNQSPWVVCTFHHPIFSTALDRDNPELRASWKPILDKYRVDLVLQGHDHTYGRTSIAVPASPRENAGTSTLGGSSETNATAGVRNAETSTGTVYVVSVSGPKMYNNSRLPFMKRIAEDTQLYQIIKIDGPRLRFEARTAVGRLYDAFELVKRTGEVNHLTEISPEEAERVRPASK